MEIAFGNAIGMTNANLQNYVQSIKPKAWYKSTSINQADNTSVSTWSDISGNSYNFTQATSANQPTFKTNIINGKPAILFDGTDDRMEVATSTAIFKFLHSTNSTVFMVCQAGTVVNPGVVYGLLHTGTGTSTIGFYFRYIDSGANNDRINHSVFFGSSGLQVSSNITSNGTFLANKFNYFNVVSKPTDAIASERSAIQIDAGTVIKGNTFTNTASTSNSTNNLTVGGYTSNFLNGYMAEIIIFDKVLTTGEISLVNQYIKQEYDL